MADRSINPKNENIIQDFLLKPEETMRSIYRENREVFFSWARNRSRLGDDDLADLFQECVIIFCQNIRKGKLLELTSSVRTYLFGIGKNLIQSKFRSNERMTFPGEENLVFPPDFDAGIEQKLMENEETSRLENALAKLTEACQNILKLTFYENKKSAEIADSLGYASEEVVRVQRKRCLDRLRTIFK